MPLRAGILANESGSREDIPALKASRAPRANQRASPSVYISGERRDVMFSAIYDKADWGVGVLLLAAMVCAMLS